MEQVGPGVEMETEAVLERTQAGGPGDAVSYVCAPPLVVLVWPDSRGSLGSQLPAVTVWPDSSSGQCCLGQTWVPAPRGVSLHGQRQVIPHEISITCWASSIYIFMVIIHKNT